MQQAVFRVTCPHCKEIGCTFHPHARTTRGGMFYWTDRGGEFLWGEGFFALRCCSCSRPFLHKCPDEPGPHLLFRAPQGMRRMRQASAEEVEQLLEDALRSVDAGRYRIDPEPLHHDPRDVLRLRIILLQTYDDPARGGGPAVPLAMGGLGAGIAAWAFVHVQCASVALVVALLWVVLFLFEAGFEHQMLWWRSEPENPEHRNLVCLFDLLGEEDIDERLLKAEVGRRLGRFDEALRLASLVGLEQASVGLMTLAVCIRNLAEKQRRKLSSLGWPEFEMIGRPGPQRVEAQRYGEPPSRPRSSQQ